MAKKETKNKLELTVKIEGEEWTKAVDASFKKNVKNVAVDGFRKGKCPRDIYEKKYGKESLYIDAAEGLLQDAYRKVMEENKDVIPVVRPSVDIKSIDENGVEFSFIIITSPEVKIKKYKGLKVKKEKVEVTKEEIEHELGHLLERYTELVTKEGKVEEGDIAVIDFEGFKDGVAFEGGKGENYSLEIGSNTFIPGFEDQLIGLKKGEETDVNVSFPENYFSKELAGKPATFKVKVNEIKTKEYPKMDDEFAKDVSEFDTLKELKADTRAHLEEENSRRAKYEMEEDAIEEVTHSAKIDIPAKMLDAEIDGYIHDMNHRLEHQGMTLDMYMQMMNTDLASVRDEFRGKAEHNIMTRLVLEAIFEAEKIEITDEDINKKLADVAKEYGRDAEEFVAKANDQVKEFAKEELKYDLAVKFIMDNAK